MCRQPASRLLFVVLCPALAFAGLLGEIFGQGLEVSLQQPVSVLDCQVSSFSAWSACSVTCGIGGLQERTRNIVRQPILWQGGKACPHVMRQTRQCTPIPTACPGTPTPAPCTASTCVCACLAQTGAAQTGADWKSACTLACDTRAKLPHGHSNIMHKGRKPGRIAGRITTAQVAQFTNAQVSSKSDEQTTHLAQLRLQQAPNDSHKLQILVSNSRGFGGFRLAIEDASTGAAAPVGAAAGGQAAAKGFGLSTDANSGTVLGFSEVPYAQFEPTMDAVGTHYHVLAEVALRRGSGYSSWYAFSHKLCVKGAVLSDGKGGSVSVANSCSVLANPNTSAPTPSPTPRPAFMDLALRFAATTSAAFDVSVRRALRQAVSTATMIPLSDVHLIRVMPGGNNAGYYVDVTFALAAPTLEYVNRVEDRVVTHEAFFVSTVVDRLFAQGVHILARKGAESRLTVHAFKVAGFGSGNKAAVKSRDCRFSWAAWGRCSVVCGGDGSQTRRAVIIEPAAGAGAACPAMQTRSCGDEPCRRTRSPTPAPTPYPTPSTTAWYEAAPTQFPTPRPTRKGEVYTHDTCTHTICRVLASHHKGKKVHVIRVMHAAEERRGVRHRCMYNEELRECLCRCSTVDSDLCPTWNPDCMTSDYAGRGPHIVAPGMPDVTNAEMP